MRTVAEAGGRAVGVLGRSTAGYNPHDARRAPSGVPRRGRTQRCARRLRSPCRCKLVVVAEQISQHTGGRRSANERLLAQNLVLAKVPPVPLLVPLTAKQSNAGQQASVSPAPGDLGFERGSVGDRLEWDTSFKRPAPAMSMLAEQPPAKMGWVHQQLAGRRSERAARGPHSLRRSLCRA